MSGGRSKAESEMRKAETSLSGLSVSAVKHGPGGAGPYRDFVKVNVKVNGRPRRSGALQNIREREREGERKAPTERGPTEIS